MYYLVVNEIKDGKVNVLIDGDIETINNFTKKYNSEEELKRCLNINSVKPLAIVKGVNVSLDIPGIIEYDNNYNFKNSGRSILYNNYEEVYKEVFENVNFLEYFANQLKTLDYEGKPTFYSQNFIYTLVEDISRKDKLEFAKDYATDILKIGGYDNKIQRALSYYEIYQKAFESKSLQEMYKDYDKGFTGKMYEVNIPHSFSKKKQHKYMERVEDKEFTGKILNVKNEEQQMEESKPSKMYEEIYGPLEKYGKDDLYATHDLDDLENGLNPDEMDEVRRKK